MSADCCKPTKTKGVYLGRKDPFIIGAIIVTALILIIAVYFGTKTGASSQVVADSQVVATIDTNKHDWGTIDINGGIVSKSFVIKNTSNSILKLYNVTTSCMCTTAQLKSQEARSKKYGMHEKSTDVFEVKAGDSAELIVEFDPMFHGPSGVGPINRTVTISTNDANNPTLLFSLAANVINK